MSFEIVDYSEKSIAVFGDIQKYDSHFNELKGMFNANLKYKGEARPGFIFTKFKRPQVLELVRKLKVLDSTDGANDSEDEKKDINIKKTFIKNDDNVVLSREQFMNLVSTLNRLEQDVAHLKKQVFQHGSIVPNIAPIEKEIKKKEIKSKTVLKKEESSDEDNNDFDDGDVDYDIPQTKGPSLLKLSKKEVEKKEEVKKGPSLLRLNK